MITLLFHLALLWGIAYKPVRIGKKRIHRKQVVLLNLADNHFPGVGAFKRWLIYHSPSLFAKPDYNYGYESLSVRNAIRPPIDNIAIDQSYAALIPAPDKFSFLPLDDKAPFDSSARFVDYATLPIQKLPVPPPAHHPYPLVKLSDGRYLDGILTFEELQYRHLMPSVKIGITRLRVMLSGTDLLPRVVIEKSCGNPKLDRLAVQKILLNQQALTSSHSALGKVIYVDIIWREVEK